MLAKLIIGLEISCLVFPDHAVHFVVNGDVVISEVLSELIRINVPFGVVRESLGYSFLKCVH